jgi:hypothetical protein
MDEMTDIKDIEVPLPVAIKAARILFAGLVLVAISISSFTYSILGRISKIEQNQATQGTLWAESLTSLSEAQTEIKKKLDRLEMMQDRTDVNMGKVLFKLHIPDVGPGTSQDIYYHYSQPQSRNELNYWAKPNHATREGGHSPSLKKERIP